MAAKKLAATFLAAALMLGISACSMKVDKTSDGKDKDVDIKTPVGNLSVHKGGNVKDTGIDVYAKATPKHDNNDDSANVNLSVPGFGMKVEVESFSSEDSPEKVLSFYRDNFKKHYATVIECKGSYGNVSMHRDKDKDLNRPVSCDSGSHGSETVELKAGTEGNQHIVAIKPDGTGTEFKLVYLKMQTKDDKENPI